MRIRVFGLLYLTLAASAGFAQAPAPSAVSAPAIIDQQSLNKVLDRLASDEARIKELEQKLEQRSANSVPSKDTVSVGELSKDANAAPSKDSAAAEAMNKGPQPAAPVTEAAPAAEPPPAAPPVEAGDMAGMGGHTLELPGGGPDLKVRGYLDFNFGTGSLANPLLFSNGVDRSGFQVGEFALMASSQLSPKLSFMSELVVGSDYTNLFSVDIERYLLTYKASKYFEASTGRFHTAIGYYSTAYHHGTWFQTATGRPLMYYFEDSGGLLPVHTVGVSLTGLVPGTDALGLHWVAEIGNGRASDKFAAEPVQNFYSDRNHRAVNLAAYIVPTWARGLQIGGSYYMDRLAPPGLAPVGQTIGSFYTIYISSAWEFLNEGVLMTNHVENGGRTFNTPLAYTQLSHKFGAWRPYLRYQYINSPQGDPVNLYTGLYMGPSVGLRYDFADYAAFKLQYNRLDEQNGKNANGLDAQIAFTF